MMQAQSSSKIKPHHLQRKAVVYMRQSTERQVLENLESQRLQRDLQALARELGWRQVEVLDHDHDLGSSASLGAKRREDFDRLVGSVALGDDPEACRTVRSVSPSDERRGRSCREAASFDRPDRRRDSAPCSSAKLLAW